MLSISFEAESHKKNNIHCRYAVLWNYWASFKINIHQRFSLYSLKILVYNYILCWLLFVDENWNKNWLKTCANTESIMNYLYLEIKKKVGNVCETKYILLVCGLFSLYILHSINITFVILSLNLRACYWFSQKSKDVTVFVYINWNPILSVHKLISTQSLYVFNLMY